MISVGIVGLGLIGLQRIEAIQTIASLTNEVYISSIFDTNQEILNLAHKKYNIPMSHTLDDLFELKPDWTFIATPNNVVKNIAEKAFNIGSNVLLEKPFGRSLQECNEIISYKPDYCKLNVGFNYRFFAGIESALNDFNDGKFGKLISVNLILGHGNSPGMEKSWKLDPIKCGHCVTDLGVHLFDLILQLSDGNVNINYIKNWSGFWNTGVIEESHFIASDKNNTIFNAQVSYNRWKSTFRLEINGSEGYGIVTNRGRSYGPQSYIVGKRWGWLDCKSQSESEHIIVNRDPCEDSFIKETLSVLELSDPSNKYNSRLKACSYEQAQKSMMLLDQYDNFGK